MYVSEWGEMRAILTSDVSSPHLSLGVRVSCMGAANHRHEHHRHEHHRYDGHEHYGNEHHDRYDNRNDGYHHRYDNGNHRHYHSHEPNRQRNRERIRKPGRRYDNRNGGYHGHKHHTRAGVGVAGSRAGRRLRRTHGAHNSQRYGQSQDRCLWGVERCAEDPVSLRSDRP
jgi:hypothetical protein